MTAAKPIPADFVDPEWFKARVRIDPATGCHEWQGSRASDGYGRVTNGRGQRQAHRVALHLAGVTLGTSDIVDHLCRNHCCVNTSHLDVTTSAENTARGISPVGSYLRAIGRGVCKNGHVLADVGFHKAGKSRTCAQCGRDRVAAYQSRMSAS